MSAAVEPCPASPFPSGSTAAVASASAMDSDPAAPRSHFGPAHQAPQPSPSSAAVDEDDLLALLNNDLAIDTKRDRELVVLSSFLKGVLPPAAGSVAHPLPPNLSNNVTIGNAATAQHLGGWNGWRPNGEGIAAPFGSPMSFASTSSALSGMPPGPSTSFGTAFSPSSGHPFASPKNGYVGLPSQSPAPRSSPFARSSGSFSSPSQQSLPAGVRAPACSRERVPTLSSINANAEMSAPPTPQAEEGGWKTRLRSSKPRQPPAAAHGQQQQQQISATAEEDVTMN
ncbi:hypothetical protein JCM8202_001474 [Rhodotorula sphaerocarpa]